MSWRQCRAPSEAAGGDGAAVPPPSASAGRNAALCRKPRISRWSELQYNYPDEPTESGLEPQAELERLTWEGAANAIPTAFPKRSTGFIRHELAIVAKLNYARYFLTVHDIVKFARSQGHSLPGARLGRQFGDLLLPAASPMSGPTSSTRCSSASSRWSATSRRTSMSISSMRGATRSSPISTRNTAQKRTALAASVVTYRGRSALREVAKAMGLSDDVSERAFRLDLGLVVLRARRKGGQGGRPRQEPIRCRGM